ncbi:uncharacterized protein LOC118481282 [Helianthus annuus]|uniref:uncharacterized protein LOC118481282 n=1 Tax=Helianthus annuus TaxID=4232 RepID=UPI001652C8DE|nr:uncharacterized protein LOC118481282 [Helianthus annuus]
MSEGFYIRETLDQRDVDQIYEVYDTLFTARLHHGGNFTHRPGRQYVNGKHDFINHLDSDRFSVHELDLAMIMLGYEEGSIMFYHFLIPGESLDSGLRSLACDADVIELLKYVPEHRVVDFYTEHGNTNVNYNRLGVHIEEINEVGQSSGVQQEVGMVTNWFRVLKLGWHEVGQSSGV